MRHFFSILLVGFSLLGFSQDDLDTWVAVPIVDEFGDATGDTARAYVTEGTFSNSATSGSGLSVRISLQRNNFFFELFEYNRRPQAVLGGSNGAFGNVRIKREDGSVEDHRVFASPSGGILVSEGSELADIMHNGTGEVIRVIVYEKEFSKYGSSAYSFKVKTL